MKVRKGEICPECGENWIAKHGEYCEMCWMVGAYHQYEVFEPDGKLDKPNMDRCEKEYLEFKKTVTNRDIFYLNLVYWHRGANEHIINEIII
jgi:hypothetical protein